ncbi:Major facilitator superfamily domain, general substrate transporter [Niveomyces insectorum RCEF 264]|uniref:Major facilitator superfamily domain, general substrate transporter n=1 Tax=Niveomyces insectorum RCEF 264 TaxID=1081102 RepID=A0A167YPF1_9HYPO|nr:Major facilitator superfamily domain, general substrate transporter [Niveomyces insectorum RCEF 264]
MPADGVTEAGPGKPPVLGSGSDTDDNTPTMVAYTPAPESREFRDKEKDPEKNSLPDVEADADGDGDGDARAATIEGVAPSDGAAPPPPPSTVSEAPDGGWEAWSVVFGAWCTSFCSFGWINSVGIFQNYYENGPLKDYSASTISWIPSLQIFFMMGMGPIIGRLFDAYGPRHVLFCGTILAVFGLMMASLSTQYYQFLLAQGVCSAIGVSGVFQPALSCIPGWFTKHRGAAFGILSTGSSLGGVIFPIMVSRLIERVGYGWAMRASAFLILGLLVCANLTVRSRLHANGARAPPLTRAQMQQPFHEVGFVLLLLGLFFLTFGIFAPINYIPVQALATGSVDFSLSQYLVSIFNACSLVGRLLSGWLADRIGKFNTFMLSGYMSGILVLALWIPGKSQPALIAFSSLFGFASGAYVSLLASLVAQVSPHKEMGYRTGLVFLVGSIPGLITSPIAGAILGDFAHGNWVGVQVFAGVLLLVGSSIVLMSRIKYTGFKLVTVF